MGRKILHVDLDAFFCSVEALLQPELAGKPFVVGGRPGSRGVVASASYPARAFGVRSAMPTSQALRLCPHLIVVSGRHGTYGEYSHKVMALLRDSAPLVEPISIDEAFLDVSDDPRSGQMVAEDLKAAILHSTGLTTSWGVAESKLVAKIATEVGKPDGLITVPPGKAAEFLAPLPVSMLWGVGPKTRAALDSLGVQTIGELAVLQRDRLAGSFGDRAGELIERARGIDDRPVVDEHQVKSVSSETTFDRDLDDRPALERVLRELSDEVGRRLRAEARAARTIRLKLRWSDFTTITRQVSLPEATDHDGEIFSVVQTLFRRVWRPGRPVRLLGVGGSELVTPARQLGLFEKQWQEDDRLLKAVDEIRARYGRDALRRAAQLRSQPSDDEPE